MFQAVHAASHSVVAEEQGLVLAVLHFLLDEDERSRGIAGSGIARLKFPDDFKFFEVYDGHAVLRHLVSLLLVDLCLPGSGERSFHHAVAEGGVQWVGQLCRALDVKFLA